MPARTRPADDLARAIARLWRVPPARTPAAAPSTAAQAPAGPPAPRRGRPAELDAARVIQAAIAIADRQGLAGLTLPNVAKTLGFTTMALYRHVGSREGLLLAMRDAAAGPPPSLDTAPGDWREGLRRWALAERARHRRHPWLARLPITGPPVGPNGIGWMETALQALRGTGLSWPGKLGLLLLISGYVRQTSLLAQDLDLARGTGAAAKAAERRYGRLLARVIDPGRFPEMARLLASGVFDAPATGSANDEADRDFAFGLERILDGAATVAGRGAGRSRRLRKV